MLSNLEHLLIILRESKFSTLEINACTIRHITQILLLSKNIIKIRQKKLKEL